MKSLSGRDVDSICQRCDDKTCAVTEVFIPIVEACISNLEDEVLLTCIKETFELGLPLELVYLGDALPH